MDLHWELRRDKALEVRFDEHSIGSTDWNRAHFHHSVQQQEYSEIASHNPSSNADHDQ